MQGMFSCSLQIPSQTMLVKSGDTLSLAKQKCTILLTVKCRSRQGTLHKTNYTLPLSLSVGGLEETFFFPPLSFSQVFLLTTSFKWKSEFLCV